MYLLKFYRLNHKYNTKTNKPNLKQTKATYYIFFSIRVAIKNFRLKLFGSISKIQYLKRRQNYIFVKNIQKIIIFMSNF